MALKPAPFTELRDADAILNFIFDPRRSFIGALPGPPPSATAAAPTAAAASAPATAATPAAAAAATAAASTPKAAEPTAEEVEYRRVSALEQSAVVVAEAGNFAAAVALFDAIVSECPTRASGYSNRAQARRLAGDAAGAKADLDTAVELAHTYLAGSGTGTDAAAAATAAAAAHPESLVLAHRNVLKQAYTQRAVYYHGVGDTAAEEADLHAAAAYGSTMARIMTTGTNPYAALCSTAFLKMTGGGGAPAAGDADSAAPAAAPCPAASSDAAPS